LEILCTRTVSPSTHPRPTSGGATDFLPASALSSHQEALRPPSGEDARCVQSMSATQTNYVHPHLARSRLALAAFTARTPHGVSGSVQHDRGSERFTTSGTASADRIERVPQGCMPAACWAWACSSHDADAIEPLTLLSRPSRNPHASLAFASAAPGHAVSFWELGHGSEGTRTAKTATIAAS
jgi:hypothetical protein